MRILVVVTFGGLSFWLTPPPPALLIKSIQQRHAGLEFVILQYMIMPADETDRWDRSYLKES